MAAQYLKQLWHTFCAESQLQGPPTRLLLGAAEVAPPIRSKATSRGTTPAAMMASVFCWEVGAKLCKESAAAAAAAAACTAGWSNLNKATIRGKVSAAMMASLLCGALGASMLMALAAWSNTAGLSDLNKTMSRSAESAVVMASLLR